MRLWARGVVVFTLTAGIPGVAEAQRLPTTPLDSGTLIRAHLASGETVRGRLLRTVMPSSSVLTFCRYPATPCASLFDQHVDSLPASQVTRLDVAHGNHLLKGALIGGAAAAPFGWVWWEFAGLCEESGCKTEVRRAAVGMVVFGVALGMLFGSQSVGWRPAQ